MAATDRDAVRRRAVASTRVLCLSVLLAACGALTPGSGYDANTGRPRAVPSSTAVPDGDITLRLNFADAPEMVDALAAAFEEKHPRIDVRPQYTQFADYVKSLKLTMTSDTAPDIAQYAIGMDALAHRGDILDLAPYRDAYGWRDAFPASSLAQLTAGRSESLYGVPVGLSMTGLYVNRELAATAGISRPPRTLAEFENRLAAAKRAGLTPLSIGALDSGGLHLWAALVNVLMPPETYRAWVDGRDGATIETEGALKAAELVAEWAAKGYFDPSANGTAQVDSTARFTRGESVFLVNGNWAAGQLVGAMGENVGFFPMPGPDASSRSVASGFSVAYSVSSRTRHPEAAGAFLDFLASPEAASIVAANGFLPPDPDTDAVPEQKGVLGEVAAAHRRVVADDGTNQFPDFTAPSMLDRLRSGVQRLIAARVGPAEFLAEIQDVWEAHHGK
ncbi:extracellular solute-binding protein [Streptomyces niveus]|uniref:Extracellular solute-binding protein n=1 Tax=Streptomyces niveus TaxID=193462 RepID=A0ABZ2AH07_STRNV|nr:extracellular solute-binding protein [Streptomyces niveus]